MKIGGLGSRQLANPPAELVCFAGFSLAAESHFIKIKQHNMEIIAVISIMAILISTIKAIIKWPRGDCGGAAAAAAADRANPGVALHLSKFQRV